MAKGDGLLFADGFDYYLNNNTATATSPHARWIVPNFGDTSSQLQARTDASRYSTGKGLQMPNNRNPALVLGGDFTDVIVGCAFKTGGTNNPHVLFYFMDGTSFGDTQVAILFDFATNRLEARRGQYNGTLLGTSSVVPYNISQAWAYIEARVKVHNSTGTVTLRFNGVEVLALTSQDTQNTANEKITIVGVGNSVHTYSTNIDDFYFVNGSASGAEFLGDVRIEATYPTAEGNSTQFTPLSGTDNALMVDDEGSGSLDDDTTYNSSATATHKDTYVMGNPTQQVGDVYAVDLLCRARKDDGGTREIANVARHSGSETDGATQSLSTSYVWLHDILKTKPGGGAWSVTDVNNMEAGVKLVT